MADVTHVRPEDDAEVLARVREGLPLVDRMARHLARRYRNVSTPEDLASHGREGLLTAARTYDPSRGVPFVKWAALRARGSMVDAVRSRTVLPRRVYRELRALERSDDVQQTLMEEDAARPHGTAEQAHARLCECLALLASSMTLTTLASSSAEELDGVGADAPDPEEATAAAELARNVRQAIEERPDNEKHLLRRVYFDGATIDEAAGELGLSKSWGSRLHARALEGMAKALRGSRSF